MKVSLAICLVLVSCARSAQPAGVSTTERDSHLTAAELARLDPSAEVAASLNGTVAVLALDLRSTEVSLLEADSGGFRRRTEVAAATSMVTWVGRDIYGLADGRIWVLREDDTSPEYLSLPGAIVAERIAAVGQSLVLGSSTAIEMVDTSSMRATKPMPYESAGVLVGLAGCESGVAVVTWNPETSESRLQVLDSNFNEVASTVESVRVFGVAIAADCGTIAVDLGSVGVDDRRIELRTASLAVVASGRMSSFSSPHFVDGLCYAFDRYEWEFARCTA